MEIFIISVYEPKSQVLHNISEAELEILDFIDINSFPTRKSPESHLILGQIIFHCQSLW